MENDTYEVRPFKFDLDHIRLEVLDQNLLPDKIDYVEVNNLNDGYRVIKDMVVRGAPCIAAVGCLCLVVSLEQKLPELSNFDEVKRFLESSAQHLISARPTAVNLSIAINELLRFVEEDIYDHHKLVYQIAVNHVNIMKNDILHNKKLADYGASEVLKDKKAKVNVLTHCNTGSLATVGYGTALGIIRTLHKRERLSRVYCTETRPYNQGSRLTAWELTRENIPTTLIADSMVGYLFQTHKIDAVVVGADRVASNGDTANKIGTFQIALLAEHFKIPVYVAAPSETIDMTCTDLNHITIEQRPADELRQYRGIRLAPDEVDVWNPSFDVTPNKYIKAIITSRGAFRGHPFRLSV